MKNMSQFALHSALVAFCERFCCFLTICGLYLIIMVDKGRSSTSSDSASKLKIIFVVYLIIIFCCFSVLF